MPIMDLMLEGYLHESILDPDDIPQTKDPVWILGKEYKGYEGKIDFNIYRFQYI